MQCESKMKACLGQRVSQKPTKPLSQKESRSKRVPAEVTEQEFKEFLALNKIDHAKAERLTCKKDGRVLEYLNWKSKTIPKPRH